MSRRSSWQGSSADSSVAAVSVDDNTRQSTIRDPLARSLLAEAEV
jgi:hypothetical protein